MIRVSATFGMACLALAAAFIGALGVGRYPLSPWDVLHVLGGHGSDTARAVVMQARLPRLLAAAILGGALSVSGGAYQAVLRNPLVSPGMLGVLSGAAFGAAGAILLGASPVLTQIGAFGGGVAAVAVGLCIARMLGTDSVFTLLLGGIVSNAAFTALVSLVKYVADPFDQLPAIVYWLLGSVAQVGWGQIETLAPLLLAGTLVLLLCARVLDALSLSDDEARSLGIPVTALRLGVIAVATFVSAMTVSLAGIIGWIGLLVPHLARLLVGASHTRMLPLSLVLGATCLVVADTLARTLSAGEIPLGIITELFGAVAFVLVLRRLRGSMP